MEAPRHWRLKEERLRGSTKADCCKMPVVRKKPVTFVGCECCDTKLAYTDEGFPYTKFGDTYLKIREEKQGYQIELSSIRPNKIFNDETRVGVEPAYTVLQTAV